MAQIEYDIEDAMMPLDMRGDYVTVGAWDDAGNEFWVTTNRHLRGVFVRDPKNRRRRVQRVSVSLFSLPYDPFLMRDRLKELLTDEKARDFFERLTL